MNPKVLFLGSIGAVAETSELQRQAYNQALKENNVNWEWNQDTYKDLLQSNGGKDRLQTLSAATSQNLSQEQIDKIHSRKTEIAGQLVREKQVTPRPGIVNLIKKAKEEGAKVAWVTTTGKENTDAILEASAGQLSANDFDHIFHRDDAPTGKPSPDIYQAALKHYNVDAADCIAVEDSLNSVLSAKGAGVYTVATLGDYHNEYVDNIADHVAPSLEQVEWSQLVNNYQGRQSVSS